MKKKGFTLIELIVVIVVIGILTVVTFPIVNNVIENSRQKSYNTTVQNIKTSASLYSTEFIDNLRWFVASENDVESNEEWTCVQIKKLIEKGYLKDIRKTNDENAPFLVDPKDEGKITTVNNFVELRRDTTTHSVLRDMITLDSEKCNGSYDSNAPQVSVALTYADSSSVYNQGWTDKDIIQTITVRDANGISLLQMKYEDESENAYRDIPVETKDDTTWVAVLTQTEDIEKRINIRARDYFENENNSTSYSLLIDKIGPSCNIELIGTKANESNEWYVSEVTVKLNINGISAKDYQLSDVELTNPTYPSSNTDQSRKVTDDGTKKYYGYVKDKLGRTNSCEMEVKKDSVTPTPPSLSAYPSTFVKNISSPSAIPPTTATFGLSGGTTTCTCNGNECTNINSLSNGSISIVCTATGNNGLVNTSSKTITLRNCSTSYPSCSCGRYVYNECGNSKWCGSCCQCSSDSTCHSIYNGDYSCNGCNCYYNPTTAATTACECSSNFQCQSKYGYSYSCDGCKCSYDYGDDDDSECSRSSDCASDEYCTVSGVCLPRSVTSAPTTASTSGSTSKKTTSKKTTACATKIDPATGASCCKNSCAF